MEETASRCFKDLYEELRGTGVVGIFVAWFGGDDHTPFEEHQEILCIREGNLSKSDGLHILEALSETTGHRSFCLQSNRFIITTIYDDGDQHGRNLDGTQGIWIMKTKKLFIAILYEGDLISSVTLRTVLGKSKETWIQQGL